MRNPDPRSSPRGLLLAALLAAAGAAPARADVHGYFGGSFIGGESATTAADGWHMGIGGIAGRGDDIALRWDFGIDGHDMRPEAIANTQADDGDLTTAYLRFGPQWDFEGYDSRFYLSASAGYYWTRADISMEVLVPGLVCDPFWGWCWTTLVPGELVLDERQSSDWGYSATIGYEWLLEDGGSWFIEVQYHQARHGEGYAFTPLVIGLRW